MKQLFIATIMLFTLLSASTFNTYYLKGNKSYEVGNLDKAYINYTKAYNYAKSKKEKIMSLGALAEVSKQQGLYSLSKDYAKKILAIDSSNKYAKKILKSNLKSSKKSSFKKGGKLTKQKVINLICSNPHGNSCKCKDVKFFGASDYISASDTLGVEQIIKGNFIHKNEAVANLSGCKAHSSNWGGYLFLKKGKSGWEAVKYNTPYLGNKCKKIHLKNGKDGFVCESGYTNQGYLVTTLSLNYFDKYLRLKDKVIYQGEDNSGAVGANSPEYKNTSIKSWKLVKKGNSTYAIIKVYNEDAKHKNRVKTIKKRVN